MAREVDEDSGLVAHAVRELEFAGVEEDVRPSIIEAVRAFASYGHSGGSAAVCTMILNELLQYKALTSLTDNPAEWMHITEPMAGQPNLWQNVRQSEAFSNDGGKTYYLLSEERRWIPFWLRYKLRRLSFGERLCFKHHKSVHRGA